MSLDSANQPRNAYEALAQDDEESRWAYGTGFVDPLATVDRAVPSGVSAADLVTYCLMLGDDALILSQRLSAWCSRGPELEEDVALANIALDLLGQARLLLTRAGEVEGLGRDEDALAYLRDEHDFRNVALCEPPDGTAGPAGVGDFGFAIARLLVFSTWRLALFERLESSRDPVLAAVAAKGVKELAPRCRTLGCGPRSRPCGRSSTSCSCRTRWNGGWPGLRSTRLRCVTRCSRCSTPCCRRRRWSGLRDRGWLGSVGEPGATVCTPRRWVSCWPRCSRWPGRIRGRRGERC
jgi:Phenylacetic acid catabolic protein